MKKLIMFALLVPFFSSQAMDLRDLSKAKFVLEKEEDDEEMRMYYGQLEWQTRTSIVSCECRLRYGFTSQRYSGQYTDSKGKIKVLKHEIAKKLVEACQ